MLLSNAHDTFELMESIILLYHATLTLLIKQRAKPGAKPFTATRIARLQRDVVARATQSIVYRQFSKTQLQLLPVQAMIAGIPPNTRAHAPAQYS